MRTWATVKHAKCRKKLRGPYLLAASERDCVPRPFMAHSFGTVGLCVGLGDGAVRVLSPTISPETWNRAMQPNDGVELGLDW